MKPFFLTRLSSPASNHYVSVSLPDADGPNAICLILVPRNLVLKTQRERATFLKALTIIALDR